MPAAGSKGAKGSKGPLDRHKLEELTDLMGEELPRLIGSYLEVAPQLLGDLDRAAANSDLTGMILPAHSLKSSSANIAARRVAKTAAALEKAARAGDMEPAMRAYRRLGDEWPAVKQALQSMLQS